MLSVRTDSGFLWSSLSMSQMDAVSSRRREDPDPYVLRLLHVAQANSACLHHLLHSCQPRVASFILAICGLVDAFREAKRLWEGFPGNIWEAAFEPRAI